MTTSRLDEQAILEILADEIALWTANYVRSAPEKPVRVRGRASA